MSRVKDAVITVRPIDGQWETIGTDRARGISHEKLRVVSDLWGPLSATFDLKRAPGAPWPDMRAATDLDIDIGTQRRWKGRVKATPARDGADRSLSLIGEGMQAHLDDDCYQPVYVHARMSDWKDMRSTLRAPLGAAAYCQAGQVSSDNGILIGFKSGEVLLAGASVGVYFDLGPGLIPSAISFDFETSNNNNSAAGPYFELTTTNDLAVDGTLTSQSALTSMGAGPSTQPTAILTGAERYIIIKLQAQANVTVSGDCFVRLRGCRVFFNTAYVSSNQSALKASTVFTDALAKATILLDPDRSLIEATTFNIPDLASLDDKTPREVINAVNGYHNWLSKIDEWARPIFKPLPASPTLEVGQWTALEGTDASQNELAEIHNRAIVEAQTPSGEPVRVERLQHAERGAKHSVQLSNPSADVDVANWATTNPGGITRDTGVFDTTPGSFRLLSMPYKTTATGTVAAGTFEKHKTYVLALRFRPDAHLAYGAFSDPWADQGSCQFQFGTSTDFGKVTLRESLTGGTWTTHYVPWSPNATVTSGVEFRYLQGTYGTNSLRLDSFEIYQVQDTIVDRRGFRRTKRLQVTAALASDGIAATQIADAYLSTHKLAQFKGDYQITGPVRDILTGRTVPPDELLARTGELLLFMDRTDPDTGAVGRVGRIVQVTYDYETDQATVAIDNTSSNFLVLLERLGAISGTGR